MQPQKTLPVTALPVIGSGYTSRGGTSAGKRQALSPSRDKQDTDEANLYHIYESKKKLPVMIYRAMCVTPPITSARRNTVNQEFSDTAKMKYNLLDSHKNDISPPILNIIDPKQQEEVLVTQTQGNANVVSKILPELMEISKTVPMNLSALEKKSKLYQSHERTCFPRDHCASLVSSEKPYYNDNYSTGVASYNTNSHQVHSIPPPESPAKQYGLNRSLPVTTSPGKVHHQSQANIQRQHGPALQNQHMPSTSHYKFVQPVSYTHMTSMDPTGPTVIPVDSTRMYNYVEDRKTYIDNQFEHEGLSSDVNTKYMKTSKTHQFAIQTYSYGAQYNNNQKTAEQYQHDATLPPIIQSEMSLRLAKKEASTAMPNLLTELDRTQIKQLRLRQPKKPRVIPQIYHTNKHRKPSQIEHGPIKSLTQLHHQIVNTSLFK